MRKCVTSKTHLMNLYSEFRFLLFVEPRTWNFEMLSREQNIRWLANSLSLLVNNAQFFQLHAFIS